jgi:hypothetical protein
LQDGNWVKTIKSKKGGLEMKIWHFLKLGICFVLIAALSWNPTPTYATDQKFNTIQDKDILKDLTDFPALEKLFEKYPKLREINLKKLDDGLPLEIQERLSNIHVVTDAQALQELTPMLSSCGIAEIANLFQCAGYNISPSDNDQTLIDMSKRIVHIPQITPPSLLIFFVLLRELVQNQDMLSQEILDNFSLSLMSELLKSLKENPQSLIEGLSLQDECTIDEIICIAMDAVRLLLLLVCEAIREDLPIVYGALVAAVVVLYLMLFAYIACAVNPDIDACNLLNPLI